jgi:CheY-like chemotaxis protein
MLHAFGLKNVAEASTTAGAVDYLTTQDCDLVISDEGSEASLGVGLARSIRASETVQHADIPILLKTEDTGDAHLAEARQAGVTAILAKPFCSKTLYNHVRAVIERPDTFVMIKGYFGPDRRFDERRRGDMAPSKTQGQAEH